MVHDGQPTIAELATCRAKLIRLIKDAQKSGYGESKELCTSKSGLRAIEKQIRALGGPREARKGKLYLMQAKSAS